MKELLFKCIGCLAVVVVFLPVVVGLFMFILSYPWLTLAITLLVVFPFVLPVLLDN